METPRGLASGDVPSIATLLAETAGVVSTTLEVQDVIARVAESVRRVIPFDQMTLFRIVEGDRVVLHATTRSRGIESGRPVEAPLTDWSPRWRPRAGSIPRIDDARKELDPAFRVDAKILKTDLRSGLWEPFRSGGTFAGGVWLWSHAPGRFEDAHQEVLKPVAALLGSAVEHWRIWDADCRRRQRLDQLDMALETLAETLDIRDVFERISQLVRPILAHDLMALTKHDAKAGTIETMATAGELDIPIAGEPVRLSGPESVRRLEPEILGDIPADLAPRTHRNKLMLSLGMRAYLRVPLTLWGEVHGALVFFHRQPNVYRLEDVEVARRLADRVAVVVAHRQLAEEARAAALSRERAERLEATVETLSRELASRGRKQVIGVSKSWMETLRYVQQAAPSDTTVLITGESGTGKEVVASLLHEGSRRADKPFVAVNCAALPEQLLESELFGHEKGAFTDALSTKIGRFEQAAGGTLFLDEIAEMSPPVQAKLLRVLEEREIQRVGGTRTIPVDVRVIAATNRDLPAGIGRREFREDLYYRLNVFQIGVAPLRERPQDILPLADAFLAELAGGMGRPAAGISNEAREWMLTHPWPGNVRELRNAIERAILLCDGGLITCEHLPEPMTRIRGTGRPASEAAAKAAAPADPADVNLGAMEKELIEKALQQSRGNKTRAAGLLGLSRAQLYARLRKHDIR